MLHGRERLIQKIDFPQGGVWVDLGCGTGQNVEFAGDRVRGLSRIQLVDLSPSLLAVADERSRSVRGPRVTTHLADATAFRLSPETVDVVTFSYSLTMIPDWFAAIENAVNMLRPGGVLGVTDFFISRKHIDSPEVRHRWMTRLFWQHWFAMDNVFLSGDHLAMLRRRLHPLHLEQHRGKVPYLPLLKAPYYVFVGRK